MWERVLYISQAHTEECLNECQASCVMGVILSEVSSFVRLLAFYYDEEWHCDPIGSWTGSYSATHRAAACSLHAKFAGLVREKEDEIWKLYAECIKY